MLQACKMHFHSRAQVFSAVPQSGSLVLTTDALDRVNKLADTTGHAHVSLPTVPGSPQGKQPCSLSAS